MWDLNEQIISGSPDLGGIDFLSIQYAASVPELVPGSASSFCVPVQASVTYGVFVQVSLYSSYPSWPLFQYSFEKLGSECP